MKQLLLVSLAVALSADAATAGPSVITRRTANSCGTRQHLPTANHTARIAPAVGLRTIFLNRLGGTFKSTSSGATDSRTGTFNVNNGFEINGNTAVVIPPLDNTRYNWSEIVACVKRHYQPFQVRFTESRPQDGDYIEAVVGGDGTEVGFRLQDGILGIASADDFCGVTERGIAFTFSVAHNGISQRNDELCATIAHEVGHLLALEHEQLDVDVMSYVSVANSASKAFVNEDSLCGTEPGQPQRQCSCAAAPADVRTNSGARLLQFIGARDTETVPPTLEVTDPSADLIVPPTFDVVARATDNAAMSDVTVLVDGQEVGNDGAPDGDLYKITVENLDAGQHQLTAIAHDVAGNSSTEVTLAITVELLATGATCSDNGACSGGLCAQDGDDRFCTQTCESSSSCPSDFSCDPVGAQKICVPEGGGCGCHSSGGAGPFGLLLVLGVGAIVLRRRT